MGPFESENVVETAREQSTSFGIEWDKDGFVARLYPFTRSRRTTAEEISQPRVVTMDPRVEFGRPILKVSAVPTAVIADPEIQVVAECSERLRRPLSTSQQDERRPPQINTLQVIRNWPEEVKAALAAGR